MFEQQLSEIANKKEYLKNLLLLRQEYSERIQTIIDKELDGAQLKTLDQLASSNIETKSKSLTVKVTTDDDDPAVSLLYRRLSVYCHPDKVGGTADRFKKLQQLKDEKDVSALMEFHGELIDKFSDSHDSHEAMTIFLGLERQLFRIDSEIAAHKSSVWYHVLVKKDVTGLKTHLNFCSTASELEQNLK